MFFFFIANGSIQGRGGEQEENAAEMSYLLEIKEISVTNRLLKVGPASSWILLPCAFMYST